jgi:hypothetical protein
MRPLAQSETAMSIAAPLLVGLVMVAVWEIACRTFNVPVFLFPKPSDITLKLASEWPSLLKALGMTLRVALQAFAVAIVLGTLIAFAFVQSRAIEKSLFPYAVLLQVTPIVAIAPLIIILVKNTQVALTVCATVVAIFPIISNTTLGLLKSCSRASSSISRTYFPRYISHQLAGVGLFTHGRVQAGAGTGTRARSRRRHDLAEITLAPRPTVHQLSTNPPGSNLSRAVRPAACGTGFVHPVEQAPISRLQGLSTSRPVPASSLRSMDSIRPTICSTR